jgi:RNA-dependent RNA polymerase
MIRDAAQEVDEDEEDEEDEDDDENDALTKAKQVERWRRAWAAWVVAADALLEDGEAFGPQSFGLIALGTLLEIVKEVRSTE